MVGDYRAAIDWYLNALQSEPQFLGAHIGLAKAYAMAGDDARARAETQEVRRLQPGYTFDVERRRAGVAASPPAYRAFVEEKEIPAALKAGLAD